MDAWLVESGLEEDVGWWRRSLFYNCNEAPSPQKDLVDTLVDIVMSITRLQPRLSLLMSLVRAGSG